MNRYTEPKPTHGTAEWLASRWQNAAGEKRVTASVAACVHGQHRFKTLADLAVELLAKSAPEPQAPNAAMTRGNLLEPIMGQMVESVFGVKLYTPDVMYVYEDDGVRMLANVDFRVVGDDAVWEAKSFKGHFDGVLPDYWKWQGVQLALCCDVSVVEWVVFDSDLEAKFCTQHVSSDERQQHVDAVRLFLSWIDMEMMPDGATLTYENVNTLYPDGSGGTVALGVEVADMLVEFADAKAQIKYFEQVEEQIKGALGMLLGDAEYGAIDGSRVVSWKSSTRESFDQAKFKQEHPALAEKYRKQTSVRTMRIIHKGDK